MTDDLLPAEVLEPSPPLSDHDLDVFSGAAEPTESGAPLTLTDDEAEVVDRVRHWQIDGERTASWAMAKLAAAAADQAELAALRDEYHAQIDAWFNVESSRRRHRSTIAYFTAQLEAWGLRVRQESEGKRKSIALPSGEVKTTSSAAKAVVTNEAEFLLWARKTLSDEQWEAVTTEPRVSLTGMRGLVELVGVVDEETGEVIDVACYNGQPVPGLDVEPAAVKVKVVTQ